jgi:Na+/melibiose symporter-like transporter
VSRNQVALLLALGVDNFGSGLFLPLPVLFAIRVVGLPVATAGTVITIGTMAGILAPPLAGRLVDRVGPRVVVIAAQVLQAAGAATYLVATNAGLVLVAAMLLAAGQQTFYSSLFALIADTAGPGPKDRPFAVVNTVRGACFGLGGLVAAGLLTGAGATGYRIAVAADGVSFVVAALLLALLLRLPHTPRHSETPPVGVLRNRPFLALIVVTGMFALAMDFFLVAVPVYVIDVLRGPSWLPGAMLALLTAIGSLTGPTVVRLTRRVRRTTAMACGAGLYVLWALACLAAALVPAGARPAYLLGTTVVFAAAGVIGGARATALAEAAAPPAVRGRYLAAFQYAFTAAGVVAPAVVALFATGVWLPWLTVAAVAAAAGSALPYLARRLPSHAVTGREPEPSAVA